MLLVVIVVVVVVVVGCCCCCCCENVLWIVIERCSRQDGVEEQVLRRASRGAGADGEAVPAEQGVLSGEGVQAARRLERGQRGGRALAADADRAAPELAGVQARGGAAGKAAGDSPGAAVLFHRRLDAGRPADLDPEARSAGL